MILETITYENTHTIQELMEKSVAAYSERDILRYEREDVIYHVTYSQFETMCQKIGQYLNDKKSALGRALHVGIIGEGSVNYIVALMGSMGSGNVAVPLDHQLSLANLADSLNRADVDILFYDWTHEPLVRDVKAMCPKVTEYFSMQQVQDSPDIDDILNDPRLDGQSWCLCEDYQAPKADDLAMILFTSGTTGKSKGVMLTHQNLVGNALSQSPIENDEFDEIVSVLILPMHHVFCINIDVIAMLYRGGTTCINGSIALLGKHLRMFEPTVLHIVPMIPKVLYNKIKSIVSTNPDLTEKDAMRLIYGRRLGRIICGGGGLPESLAQKYLQMGIRIGQGYGMSECSPVISEPDFEHPEKVSSAGRTLDHIEARVGESNEIQVRSPFVMKGYYGDPELTKQAFTEDGWLKTGDVGYVDDEGFIFLTGRLKNLIILSNGENVAPEELEADYGTEPLIRDILVFDEDDMIKCEVHPDYTYAEAAGIQNVLSEVTNIVNRHNKKLPSYKRIMQTSIRKAPFQKTTSNKIIRDAFFAERKKQMTQGSDMRLPENEVKRKIYDICIQVLGKRDFGLDTDLYTVGLDSFGSVLLLTDLQEKLKLSLTLADLLENPTVSKLEALYLKRGGQAQKEHTAQKKYTLTDNQKHMANTMPGNTSATLPYCFRLSNRIDMDRLEEALRRLFVSHPILLGIIEPGEDGELYMYRNDDADIVIERMVLSSREWERKKQSLVTSFFYTQKPGERLYRCGLYQTEEGKYLFIDVSHLIGDGTTMNILFEDLAKLYLGQNVKKSDYTFYEYMLDKEEEKHNGIYERDLKYYNQLLDGYELKRTFATRQDCSDLDISINASMQGRFGKVDKKAVQDYCAAHEITENAFFLTAFTYTAGIFNDVKDVVITSINNGRTDGRWVRLVGQLFVWYPFRFQRIPHQTVEELLKQNTSQILNTMSSHTSIRPADEIIVQYQGDLLNVNEICGEKAEMMDLEQDSTPFHLMIFSGRVGYVYYLWYGENRYDRSMLESFFAVMDDILAAMLEEPSVRKLQSHISANLFPHHLEMKASELNASLGEDILTEKNEVVKPYVLNEYNQKKPFGAWGRLYVNKPVKGTGKTIESLYTPGILYDTGINARITPEGRVEPLDQAGRIIPRETIERRIYTDLNALEKTLKAYAGIEDAECCIVYGEDNLFQIKAVLKAAQETDLEAVRQYVSQNMGEDAVPTVIEIQ